ncbi:MAG: hypothetical protein H0T79_05050 [Deltaproteobacteria bacterium]|nr:hypothetical protein [Deltaproteobacteria bacterium]
MSDPDLDLARAAKLSRIPGVTLAEACERYAITKSALTRARRDPASQPTLAELAIAGLTRNGTLTSGTLDLAGLAGWIDYLNHDGCTADEARRLLDPFVTSGQLVIAGERWTLARAWP